MSKGEILTFDRGAGIMYANRKYAYGILVLMLVSSVVGFYYPQIFENAENDLIKQLVEITSGKSFLELAFIIILNNLRACFVGIMLGLLFCVIPIGATIMNGYFLGAVMSVIWKTKGANSLLYVIPHGVFEIPALAISFGLGVKLGLWFRQKKKWDYVKSNFRSSMLVYFYIIVPLIVIAGIIESSLIHFFK